MAGTNQALDGEVKHMQLPHMKAPCRDCPFRKDSLKGWLGSKRMEGFLRDASFVCHKNTDLQCAGHMLINGSDNAFVQLAARLRIPLKLSGKDLVFDSKAECIKHHRN
jgi:hypothetical protein